MKYLYLKAVSFNFLQAQSFTAVAKIFNVRQNKKKKKERKKKNQSTSYLVMDFTSELQLNITDFLPVKGRRAGKG